MRNSYTTRFIAPWRKVLLAAFLGSGATAVHAQTLNYPLASASNVAGTYTDLGSTGTVIATANTDDANSAAQPIGFTFNYNGQSFTDFVLNTNGYIKLGTAAPAAPYYYNGPQVTTGGPINTAAETNLLLPFNVDLESATSATAEYRVATSGTAPNRVCTIQWKNVSDKLSGSIGKQLDNFQFQVKLYETLNRIEFVYGSATAGPGADTFKSVGVGIKGSGTSATQLISVTKGSTQAWSLASFVPGLYTGNAHNIRKAALPDAGRTYRFEPQKANDASILAVYSLGKLPLASATPHVIRAYVRNEGFSDMANVRVTLTVTGANSFTNSKIIPSLSVGLEGILSFDAFTPTAQGNNTISVSVDNDDNNSNNTATYRQQVTTDTYSVAEAGVPSLGGLGRTVTLGGIFAVRYNTNTTRVVTAVNAQLSDANSVGRTVYGVVMDNSGAILARSADYVVTTADLNAYKTFTFPAPVVVSPGNFHVGLAQAVAPAGTTAFYPMALQTEVPTRPGTFFTTDLQGGITDANDVSSRSFGRFMIEAVTGAPPTCFQPSAVSVSNASATTAVVSITGPANATGYTLIYGPRGFNPASGGTTVTAPSSPFTLTGLTASTTYDLYVRSTCGTTDQSTLVGPTAFTTLCTPPVISAFPYAEDFGTVAVGLQLPCGITVADINADNNTWKTPTAASGNISQANAMVYSYNSTDATKGADDWFFTPALALRAGSRYQLSFKYKTDATTFATAEKLEVKYGATTTPAGQTNLLWRNENITNTALVTTTGGTSANQVLPITPAADGTVYIGFHAYSAPDQFNLYVDDVAINSVVTGVSDALVRAVNVYPNPSAGLFTVEVRGAKAKGAMQVEVTNLLGQRVHTATIRDNSENRLDLSSLANGMYTLKVLSGSDYMIRNIVVQK